MNIFNDYVSVAFNATFIAKKMWESFCKDCHVVG